MQVRVLPGVQGKSKMRCRNCINIHGDQLIDCGNEAGHAQNNLDLYALVERHFPGDNNSQYMRSLISFLINIRDNPCKI